MMNMNQSMKKDIEQKDHGGSRLIHNQSQAGHSENDMVSIHSNSNTRNIVNLFNNDSTESNEHPEIKMNKN